MVFLGQAYTAWLRQTNGCPELMKSLFVEGLLGTDAPDFLELRLSSMEEAIICQDVAKAVLSGYDKLVDDIGPYEVDSVIGALASEVHQLYYLQTESELGVVKHSIFGPYSSKEQHEGLTLHNFKIISAAATYTIATYLLDIYRDLLHNCDEPIGNDSDGLIELFRQCRRFYTNMLWAMTDEKEKGLVSELIAKKNLAQSSGGKARKVSEDRALADADADIAMLAEAWWSVRREITPGHLASQIDRLTSCNTDYGSKSWNGRSIPMVSLDRVKTVVDQVREKLGIPPPSPKSGRSAKEITIPYLEDAGLAPIEWQQYKANVSLKK